MMFAILPKALFGASLVGLLAVAQMPDGWAREGVAGLSLFVLFVTVTVTFPRALEKILKRHGDDNDRLCAKLDEVKGAIAAGHTDQNELLRDFIARLNR